MNSLLDYILIGVVAVMLVAVAVMLFYNRRWLSREKEADAASKNQLNRLAIILQTGKLRLWTFNINLRRYYSISENGEETHEYFPIDFAQFYDRDDFERLRAVIFDMCDDKMQNSTLRIKSAPDAKDGQRQYEVTLSIVERDKNGHVRTLLGVQHDITEALKRETEASQLVMRYHTVFNSAFSDMIYYDKDGRMGVRLGATASMVDEGVRKSLAEGSPARRALFILAMDEEMEKKTIGTTTQNIMLMNSVPKGSRAVAPGHAKPTMIPRTMPRIIEKKNQLFLRNFIMTS